MLTPNLRHLTMQAPYIFQKTSSSQSNAVLKDGNVVRNGITASTLGGGCSGIVGNASGAYLEYFASLDTYGSSRAQFRVNPPSDDGPTAILSQTTDDGEHWDVVNVATATPPQVFDLPLAEGWTAHRASKYFKTQENVVTVYFQVHTDSPASGEVAIATLPAGFRPQATIGGTGYSKPEGGKYTPSDMKIYSDGRITGYNDVGSAEYYTGFFTFVAS